MAQELTSIVSLVGAMIFFLIAAISLKANKWIRALFFMLAMLMVPVILFVGMVVADINGLTALASIFARVYGALVIVYVFIAAMFIVKFIIFMFSMYSIKKKGGVDEDVDLI